MRVFHFVNAKYGLEDIEKRRLKLATIEDLNDPFELMWLTSRKAYMRKGLANYKEKMGALAAILCFAPNWRSPIMWSHYADRHRGLCLGFDVPDQYLIKVIYKSERQILEDIKDLRIRADNISTKYIAWEYEQEYRMFDDLKKIEPEDGLYFSQFSENLRIREVIIGARSQVDRPTILKCLGELKREVKIKTARLAFKEFAVVEQKHPALQR